MIEDREKTLLSELHKQFLRNAEEMAENLVLYGVGALSVDIPVGIKNQRAEIKSVEIKNLIYNKEQDRFEFTEVYR